MTFGRHRLLPKSMCPSDLLILHGRSFEENSMVKRARPSTNSTGITKIDDNYEGIL